MRNYISFISKYASIYNILATLDPDIERIDQYRDDISKFYECSLKRDEAFLKNMKLEGQGPGTRGQGNEVGVIVTGGFHTENLCELFQKNGISYVSIMPNFVNSEAYVSPYFTLLAGELTAIQKRLFSVITAAPISLIAIASINNILGREVWGGRNIDFFVTQAALDTIARSQGWDMYSITGVAKDGDTLKLTLRDGQTKSISIAELIKEAADAIDRRLRNFADIPKDNREDAVNDALNLCRALSGIDPEISGDIERAIRDLDGGEKEFETEGVRHKLHIQEADGFLGDQIEHAGGWGVTIRRGLTSEQKREAILHGIVAGFVEDHTMVDKIVKDLLAGRTLEAARSFSTAKRHAKAIWEMTPEERADVLAKRDLASIGETLSVPIAVQESPRMAVIGHMNAIYNEFKAKEVGSGRPDYLRPIFNPSKRSAAGNRNILVVYPTSRTNSGWMEPAFSVEALTEAKKEIIKTLSDVTKTVKANNEKAKVFVVVAQADEFDFMDKNRYVPLKFSIGGNQVSGAGLYLMDISVMNDTELEEKITTDLFQKLREVKGMGMPKKEIWKFPVAFIALVDENDIRKVETPKGAYYVSKKANITYQIPRENIIAVTPAAKDGIVTKLLARTVSEATSKEAPQLASLLSPPVLSEENKNITPGERRILAGLRTDYVKRAYLFVVQLRRILAENPDLLTPAEGEKIVRFGILVDTKDGNLHLDTVEERERLREEEIEVKSLKLVVNPATNEIITMEVDDIDIPIGLEDKNIPLSSLQFAVIQLLKNKATYITVGKAIEQRKKDLRYDNTMSEKYAFHEGMRLLENGGRIKVVTVEPVALRDLNTGFKSQSKVDKTIDAFMSEAIDYIEKYQPEGIKLETNYTHYGAMFHLVFSIDEGVDISKLNDLVNKARLYALEKARLRAEELRVEHEKAGAFNVVMGISDMFDKNYGAGILNERRAKILLDKMKRVPQYASKEAQDTLRGYLNGKINNTSVKKVIEELEGSGWSVPFGTDEIIYKDIFERAIINSMEPIARAKYVYFPERYMPYANRPEREAAEVNIFNTALPGDSLAMVFSHDNEVNQWVEAERPVETRKLSYHGGFPIYIPNWTKEDEEIEQLYITPTPESGKAENLAKKELSLDLVGDDLILQGIEIPNTLVKRAEGVTVVKIDYDNLSKYDNPEEGDRVKREGAIIMAEEFTSQGGIFVRTGAGDEALVILPGRVDVGKIKEVFEEKINRSEFRERFKGIFYTITKLNESGVEEAVKKSPTVSAGIAYIENKEDADKVLSMADIALAKSKESEDRGKMVEFESLTDQEKKKVDVVELSPLIAKELLPYLPEGLKGAIGGDLIAQAFRPTPTGLTGVAKIEGGINQEQVEDLVTTITRSTGTWDNLVYGGGIKNAPGTTATVPINNINVTIEFTGGDSALATFDKERITINVEKVNRILRNNLNSNKDREAAARVLLAHELAEVLAMRQMNYTPLTGHYAAMTTEGELIRQMAEKGELENISLVRKIAPDIIRQGTMQTEFGVKADEAGTMAQAESAADQLYGAAKKLIPSTVDLMRRNIPTHVVEPNASYETTSSVASLFRTSEQRADKNGCPIKAHAYQATQRGSVEDVTSALIENKILESFLKDFEGDVRSRMAVRLLLRSPGAEEGSRAISDIKRNIMGYLMKRYTEEDTQRIIDKILFMPTYMEDAKYLNSTIDLFTDVFAAECDRYGKPDGYPDQAVPEELGKNFLRLLRLSITNYEELFAGEEDVVEILKKIFDGSAVLRVKPIDWKNIDQWKRNNDEVLRAL
ncbi:MAG: hypothetical protein PHP46_02795 [Candidatus Omnitrophica bacterium]|nr:hypothetical protein [Candidatus Omnitrophota bacterium]